MPQQPPHTLGQLTHDSLFHVDKINIRDHGKANRPENDGQLDRQESKEPDYAGYHGVSLPLRKAPHQSRRGSLFRVQ